MTATNSQPPKGVPGVIEATRELGVWARANGDATAIAAVKAITHHNWVAADTMPAPHNYNSSAARAALDAVRSGDLPRDAFNNAADGDSPRTTTGVQAAVTLRLLHDAGAPQDLLTVLTNAYGLDVQTVSFDWHASTRAEHGTTAKGLEGNQRGGRPYVEPSRTTEPAGEDPIFFQWNADLIDRGTKAHQDLEVELANYLREQGLSPLSPRIHDQPFDVAWQAGRVLYICEVKSLTNQNEESQLRLGLGQLLSYLHRTDIEHWPDADSKWGVLAVERAPTCADWLDICAERRVTLTWPERFSDLCEG